MSSRYGKKDKNLKPDCQAKQAVKSESREESQEVHSHRQGKLSIMRSKLKAVFIHSDCCFGSTLLPVAPSWRKGMNRKSVAVTFNLLVCLKVVEVRAWRLHSWGSKKSQFRCCCCPWGMSHCEGQFLRHYLFASSASQESATETCHFIACLKS